tara:strand:- start:770 stop:1156 length:387 start_codon:yes stop_codon:yes gene_type:complete
VSVSGNFLGGVPRPLPIRLTTTNSTDIVTATGKDEILASFSLANETGSAVVVACHYYDGATDFLVFRRSVPGSDTVIVSDIPLRLYTGDKFKVTAAIGNAITVTPIIIRSHPNQVNQLASIDSVPGRG